MPAVGRCALLASWPRPPLARSAAAPPRDGRALPDMVLPDMVLPDMVLRTTGNTSPCELLAVVCGVVLHEALDELIDRAGLGQAALAGLVGQLVVGEALVALPGPAAGLLGLS